MNLKQGTLLKHGEYRIERELGHGGFGITYLATQVGLNRKVAIKEFFMNEYCNRDADTSQVTVGSEGSKELVEKFRKKFIKEAQTIAEMDNHHIIRIHDVFEDNGTAYYVMEYLPGGDLRSRIPSGGMPEAEAVGYIREVADALRYIHSKNILHLDIKPTNILFRGNGETVLIDFGISKHYDDEGGSQTSSTPVGISEGYAPTEQYEREGVSSFAASTDIYSLGATLYCLLSGSRPPKASIVLNEGLPELPSRVSAATRTAVEHAMQPRRKDRPQSVDAFLALLDAEVQVEDERTVLDDDVNDNDNDNKPDDLKPAGESTSTLSSALKKLFIPLLACVVAIVAFFGVRAYNDLSAENARLAEEARLAAKAEQTRLTGKINGHEWVDLGLSVKWATCNVGASSPSDYGSYYAWGEVNTKGEYTEANSKTYGKSLGSIAGNAVYDAARANWGGTWRMPTLEEIEELKEKCTWTWTSQGGHNGYKVTGKNGKSVFLPAAGSRVNTSLLYAGSNGYYWSATPYSVSSYAYGLSFGSDYYDCYGYDRYVGRTVRPVSE